MRLFRCSFQVHIKPQPSAPWPHISPQLNFQRLGIIFARQNPSASESQAAAGQQHQEFQDNPLKPY